MKAGRQLIFLAVLVSMLLSTAAILPTNRKVAIAQDQACPSPDVLVAQRALLEGIINDFVGIRAYKDATLNELARLNVLYYSLRGEFLRGLLERHLLMLERNEILSQTTLSSDDIGRLIEIEDSLFELAILLDGANESILQQLLLLAVLWQPVVDLIVGVSVERYERYTQRILEVREGDTDAALALAQEILVAMNTACGNGTGGTGGTGGTTGGTGGTTGGTGGTGGTSGTGGTGGTGGQIPTPSGVGS